MIRLTDRAVATPSGLDLIERGANGYLQIRRPIAVSTTIRVRHHFHTPMLRLR